VVWGTCATGNPHFNIHTPGNPRLQQLPNWKTGQKGFIFQNELLMAI
jgi:hypothetical protein